MHTKSLFILFGLFLCFFASVGAQSDENDTTEIKSFSYFTTGIFNNAAIDNVHQFKLSDQRVYHYFEFAGLEDRPYVQAVEIYDGMGDLVTEKLELVFKPKNGEYRTWFSYNFDEKKDAPGLWRFVVEFDGKHMMEQRLDVLPKNDT